MIREDLSNNLVHLVKGVTTDDALATFDKIIAEGSLLGGTGHIKGGWQCVCFTETPLAHLAYALKLKDVQEKLGVKDEHNIRYYPAGVMVTKEWLFSKKGRPVIYQPDEDYELLPDEFKYRHVRYELEHAKADRNVDWTWEREWRIQTDRLDFTPEEVTLICPDRKWVNQLAERHFKRIMETTNRARPMPSGGGTMSGVATWADLERVGMFPWHCVALEDLGVPAQE
jgi:hypothetical protein